MAADLTIQKRRPAVMGGAPAGLRRDNKNTKDEES